MKELKISTCRLGSDVAPMKNGGGYVNVAFSRWGRLEDGTYGNKTSWATVYLTDAQVKYCSERGIGKGTAVAIMGRFDYGLTTSNKDGKQYLSITINPYYMVKAPGGLGGITLATIDNVRLTEDIITNPNGTGRARAAYDTMVAGKAETRWLTLFFNESVLKRAQGLKLKKGSHIDMCGELSIEQTSYNGKEYVNASVNVGNLAYAANAGKKGDAQNADTPDAPASAAPAAPAAPTAPAAPATPAPNPAPVVEDDFGFSPVGDDSGDMFW